MTSPPAAPATVPEQVPRQVPVLVVGGGPSGLATALELGRRGVEVLLVEPRTELDPLRARAKTTNARTMEHLRRWGIADRLREAAPIPVDHAQDVVFCTSILGDELFRFPEAFALTTTRRDEYAEAGQQAPQPVVEQVLRDALAEQPSVTCRFGWTVRSIVDGPDACDVIVEDPDAQLHDVRADWVLGCDGPSGLARRAIGAAYEGGTGSAPNLSITFRSRDLEDLPLCAHAIHYWVVGTTTAGLAGRLDLDGTWWAIVQGTDGTGRDPVTMVRDLVGGQVDVEVLATDPWTARMLLVDHYRGQRVLLLGDAAHLNPPWGGHGFNTCVGDAVNLAWKLAAVLAGWADETLLDSYEQERRPVARRTIEAAAGQEQFLAPALARSTDADDAPAAVLAVDRARRAKEPEFHSLGLVLGYDYEDSSVILPDGTPHRPQDVTRYVPTARPGARLPHAWLADGRSVYDALGPELTLLRVGSSVPTTEAEEAAARLGVPLVVVDLPASLRELYGAPLLLVRPDQHVAWRGPEARDFGEVLRRVTGRRPALLGAPSPRLVDADRRG